MLTPMGGCRTATEDTPATPSSITLLLPASCFLLPASCFLLPVSCLPVITAPGVVNAPGDVGVIPRSGLCNLHEKSIFS
jgi:hypothetical protein